MGYFGIPVKSLCLLDCRYYTKEKDLIRINEQLPKGIFIEAPSIGGFESLQEGAVWIGVGLELIKSIGYNSIFELLKGIAVNYFPIWNKRARNKKVESFKLIYSIPMELDNTRNTINIEICGNFEEYQENDIIQKTFDIAQSALTQRRKSMGDINVGYNKDTHDIDCTQDEII